MRLYRLLLGSKTTTAATGAGMRLNHHVN